MEPPRLEGSVQVPDIQLHQVNNMAPVRERRNVRPWPFTRSRKRPTRRVRPWNPGAYQDVTWTPLPEVTREPVLQAEWAERLKSLFEIPASSPPPGEAASVQQQEEMSPLPKTPEAPTTPETPMYLVREQLAAWQEERHPSLLAAAASSEWGILPLASNITESSEVAKLLPREEKARKPRRRRMKRRMKIYTTGKEFIIMSREDVIALDLLPPRK